MTQGIAAPVPSNHRIVTLVISGDDPRADFLEFMNNYDTFEQEQAMFDFLLDGSLPLLRVCREIEEEQVA